MANETLTVISADRVELSTCKYCNNIHINLYARIGPNNWEKFATATVGLDQVDAFVHKMQMFRNQLSIQQEHRSEGEIEWPQKQGEQT